MTDVPPPLHRQIKEANELQRQRAAMPQVLGGVLGAGGAGVVVIALRLLGVAVAHGVAVIVLAAFVGLLGPLAIDRLIERFPDRFGFARLPPPD